jgi:hypothetical protein
MKMITMTKITMMTAELASPFDANRLHVLKTDLMTAQRNYNDQDEMLQSK